MAVFEKNQQEKTPPRKYVKFKIVKIGSNMPKTTPLQTPLLLQIEVAQNKTVLTPDTPGLDRAR